MSEYNDLLTPKEKEVYFKIINNIEGKSQRELANEMFISPNKMHTHLLNIYAKTGTKSQIELIVKHYKALIHKHKIEQGNSYGKFK